MGLVTRASNRGGRVGKWLPYYFKTFLLGRQGDGTGSTDGQTYITQTTGTSDESLFGACGDSYNCGFYYEVVIVVNSGTETFYVNKYTLAGSKIDTIYASDTSGNGRYWLCTNNSWFAIDVGVYVKMPTDVNDLDNGDVYKISLPEGDVMDRRKIYHGGYHSFLQLPSTEGEAYHSDIIPTSLKGKNVTCLWNALLDDGLDPTNNVDRTLRGCISYADSTGNNSVSVFMEWNVNPDSATSPTAGGTTYSWGSGETWLLGSVFQNDIDPRVSDVARYSQTPHTDTASPSNTTGTTQPYNVLVSGRAGHCRIKTSFDDGTGSPSIMANNQYFPCTLMID